MNTGINETGTGPCGQCGGTDTAHVDVLFPITSITAYGPTFGQPVVLAWCTACGYLTRDLGGVIEAPYTTPGAIVLGIAGPLQPAGAAPYGESLH